MPVAIELDIIKNNPNLNQTLHTYDLPYELSSETIQMIDKLKAMGYTCIMEYRPKQDWPKEDESVKDERYLFSVGKDEWITEVDKTPEFAIKNVISQLVLN